MATLEEEKKSLMTRTGEALGSAARDAVDVNRFLGGKIGEGFQAIDNSRKAAVGVMNNLPGAIAASTANAVSPAIAGAQTSFTGEKFRPQRFVGQPLFGASSPIQNAAAQPLAPNVSPPATPTVSSLAQPRQPATVSNISGAGGSMPADVWTKDFDVIQRMGARQPTARAPAARTPTATRVPAKQGVIAGMAQPQQPTAQPADYYDGKASFLQRAYKEAEAQRTVAMQELQSLAQQKNKFGQPAFSSQQLLDMAEEINKRYPVMWGNGATDNPETAKSARATFESTALNDYEKSPEFQRMQQLGDQRGALNNPAESNWEPVEVIRGMDRTFEEDPRGEFDANREARISLMSKNVGDPINHRQAALLNPLTEKQQTAERDNMTGLEKEKLAQSGMDYRTGLTVGADRERTEVERLGKDTPELYKLKAQVAEGAPGAAERLAAYYAASNSGGGKADTLTQHDMFDAYSKATEMDDEPPSFDAWKKQRKLEGGASLKPTPRAEYEALPPGSIYIGPDGKRYVKGQ